MTASKLPALLQHRHALRRRILKFRQLQAAHMPSALAVLSEDAKARTDIEEVENVRLGLPSDFSRTRQDRVCDAHLASIEERLR